MVDGRVDRVGRREFDRILVTVDHRDDGADRYRGRTDESRGDSSGGQHHAVRSSGRCRSHDRDGRHAIGIRGIEEIEVDIYRGQETAFARGEGLGSCVGAVDLFEVEPAAGLVGLVDDGSGWGTGIGGRTPAQGETRNGEERYRDGDDDGPRPEPRLSRRVGLERVDSQHSASLGGVRDPGITVWNAVEGLLRRCQQIITMTAPAAVWAAGLSSSCTTAAAGRAGAEAPSGAHAPHEPTRSGARAAHPAAWSGRAPRCGDACSR